MADEALEAATSAADETELNSSPAAETTGAEAGTAGSPTAGEETDAKPALSAEAPKSSLDAAMAALSADKEDAAQPSGVEAKDDLKTDGTTAATDGQDKPPVEDADAKVPFHKHPRWQEKLKSEREWKARAEKLEAEATSYKSAAEQYRLIEQNVKAAGLNEQEFGAGFQIMAAMKRDPAEALELLKPYYQALQMAVGEVLPDDLRQRVEDGLTDEETAKEAARLRSQAALVKQQREEIEQRRQSDSVQATQTAIAGAVHTWKETVAKADPDFARINGFVQDRFGALWAAKPPGNSQEAVALAQRAYDDVKASLKPIATQTRPGSRPLNSQDTSSARAHAQPRSSVEAAMQAMERTAA